MFRWKGEKRSMNCREKAKHTAMILVRIVPLILCVGAVAAYLLFGRDMTVESLLSYTPSNPVLAAGILLLFYVVKSLSVLFPLVILYIAAGTLFPPVTALLLNLLGVGICVSVPYWIGRFAGDSIVDKLMEKYPKIRPMVDRQRKNDFFLSFFLRIIGCLPGDVVSLYLGSLRIPYGRFLAGSVLGLSPPLVLATLIGISVTEPTSPMFLLSVSCTVLLSVGSAVFYWRYQKRRGKGRGNGSDT